MSIPDIPPDRRPPENPQRPDPNNPERGPRPERWDDPTGPIRKVNLPPDSPSPGVEIPNPERREDAG